MGKNASAETQKNIETTGQDEKSLRGQDGKFISGDAEAPGATEGAVNNGNAGFDYVAEYNRYISVFAKEPAAELSAQEIYDLTEGKLKSDVDNAELNVAPAPPVVVKVEKDSNYVYAAKENGETMRFHKLTWDFLKNGNDGWKEVVEEPKEVVELKNKKENGEQG